MRKLHPVPVFFSGPPGFFREDRRVPAFSTRLRRGSRPLGRVPGDHRPGDVHPVSGEPLVPALVHPVVGLQMADDRFDSRPLGHKLPEPSGVFVGPFAFPLPGDGDFPHLSPAKPAPSPVSPGIPGRRSASGEGCRSPLPTPPGRRPGWSSRAGCPRIRHGPPRSPGRPPTGRP